MESAAVRMRMKGWGGMEESEKRRRMIELGLCLAVAGVLCRVIASISGGDPY